MTLILWILGSIATFGLLAVVLSACAFKWAATDFEDVELSFEDGEGW